MAGSSRRTVLPPAPAVEGPRSPLRVMQVVEALAEAPEPLSLAHLATQLAIPKTSLLNHLRVLVGAHYVALQEGRYVLGSAALRLGTIIAAESRDLARLAPVARQLAADSGETALLAMLDAAALDAVYLGVYEGAQPVRYSPAVGARRPLYCTAIGRALLASQPAAFIKGYFASTELARFNKRTVTDAARLRALLAKVQAAGLAATVAEHTEGVGALASPVGDRDGRVRYAIGVAVPATRIEPDRARLEKLVRNAARAAAWTLGAKRESAG